MIPEDFQTDEPATFPTRDAELAAAVDRLEARTVPHADRDHSEGPQQLDPANVTPHLGNIQRVAEVLAQHIADNPPTIPAPDKRYWPTGAAQRARGRDDSATGHTETGEALEGAQEPVEHNHPLDCLGCQKRGAEMVALRAELAKFKRGGKTLGQTIEKQCQMLLDITGLHDWIGEDGDGDWGAVWDHAHALRPRLEAAEAERVRLAEVVERVRGVAEALVTAAQIEAHGGEEHTASLLLAVRTDLLMHLDADAPEASEEGQA